MLYWEEIIATLLGVYLVWPLIWGRIRPIWVKLFPTAALGVIIAQVWIEKFHWQLLPLYVLSFIFFLNALIDLLRKPHVKKVDRTRLLAGTVLGLLLLILTTLFPFFWSGGILGSP